MLKSHNLPRTLLTELGRVVVIWSNIEQDILLQTSAITAIKTAGRPEEFLRLDFKRLREAWYQACRDSFSKEIMDKTVHPINTEIARLSPYRHAAIHGVWRAETRGQYRLSMWEQKNDLILKETPYSLSQLRGLVVQSFNLARRVRSFTSANKSAVDSLNTLVPEEVAVIPFD